MLPPASFSDDQASDYPVAPEWLVQTPRGAPESMGIHSLL